MNTSVSATKSVRKTFFTKFDSHSADDINTHSERDLGGTEIAYEFAASVKYESKLQCQRQLNNYIALLRLLSRSTMHLKTC